MAEQPEMTDVFQFMELRAPSSPEPTALRQHYVFDDSVGYALDRPARIDADLQSADSPSSIGSLVYEQVFCKSLEGTPADNIESLVDSVLGLLTPRQTRCPATDDLGPTTSPLPLQIFELERHPHIIVGDLYYLLPERLEQIEGLSLFPELLYAFTAMERQRQQFDLTQLVKSLEAAFGGTSLAEIVFTAPVYSDAFRNAKRTLFDTLYLLYILRRRTPVNLEYVIEGLRVLHVLEALAVDSVIKDKQKGPLSQASQELWPTLETLFPELRGWTGRDALPTLPQIVTKADFLSHFTAMPVIHPIFARLHWYKQPFNSLKPIGIGDLKVVKQWLVAYLPGEISHIESVLIGETKDRTHRRLEKTEETFSLASDSKTSSLTDTQTTDRLELKREVDTVVKGETNIGVTTNSSFTGTYYAGMVVITANVGATFGYKRDTTDQTKISDTFSRDTIGKAVEQVEKNVSSRRSAVKLFETEETTTHGFVNDKPGANHIAGVYRWLDKKYKAQLFNYGKRMMFEFVIPEPAAFLVESRIRAFEAMLEVPQPPPPLVLKELDFAPLISLGIFPADSEGKFSPEAIKSSVEFRRLQRHYDLNDLSFPQNAKLVSFLDPATGDNLFEMVGTAADNDNWSAETYHCKIKAAGYSIRSLIIEGILGFEDNVGDTGTGAAANTLVIAVDGKELIRETTAGKFKQYDGGFIQVPPTAELETDDVILTIGLWDRKYFRLSIYAQVFLGPGALNAFQAKVFHKIRALEQQKIDKQNEAIQLAYDTKMSTYNNRIEQLKAAVVNDLLQGQSESFNREIIGTELKKHCITMLTKEFDSNPWNDLLSQKELVSGTGFKAPMRKFHIKETTDRTTASFDPIEVDAQYPLIELQEASKKGRFISFLEQAFEWRQLAYIFYPYFWATMPKWIEMMNRRDDTDPNLTAFLQAGSVRVLLAVTPGHDDAVLHFLATREPWEGGPAPVIGDPLFIPLHEEIRKQQDDLYNAVPEGTPWPFVLPTSLVYLDGGGAIWPEFPDPPRP